MPTLYIVGTPIGNLEDVTFRSLRVLREVSVVAAEDTRRAMVLFSRHGISTPLVSYHEQGSRTKLAPLLEKLREHDVALITDAGMPGISDPGYALVTAALKQGARVEVVPGPSAVTAALAVSGLPPDQFVFLGFLPRTPGERRRLLESVSRERRTLVVFEAPHRLRASLGDIAKVLGERRLAVCRELTKLHEEVFRGTASEALAHFESPRGEITLVIAGATETPQAEIVAEASDDEVRRRLRSLTRDGSSGRDAVDAVVAETGRARREVYRLWVGMNRQV
ncbi:MAG: 16S rRNA (cytidine(1402)-2'-O)-methyltransferase [Chloroflexi bacterium]|nr:16S rRNA (cytidine(1402)-2'-O)-methyltransferase [Chloroflexota bacterium]